MGKGSYANGNFKYVMGQKAADFYVKVGMDKKMAQGLVNTHWNMMLKTLGSESKILVKLECEEFPEANMLKVFEEGKSVECIDPIAGKYTVK